jgi:dihydrofolate reductase
VTGAVIMDRTAFEMAADPGWYAGNYEFQVPIFVVTHRPPQVTPKQDAHLTFTFVTDGVGSAVAKAKAAAGDKAVQEKIGVLEIGARTSLRFRVKK